MRRLNYLFALLSIVLFTGCVSITTASNDKPVVCECVEGGECICGDSCSCVGCDCADGVCAAADCGECCKEGE